MHDTARMNGFRRLAIVGATGGIGEALTAELARRFSPERLWILGRRAELAIVPPSLNPDCVRRTHLDLLDESSIAAAAATVAADGPLDGLVLATGLLHDGSSVAPEKSIRWVDPDAMARVFAVNTIGPALVAKHFAPSMPRKGRTLFAALSARVGSIDDNRLGGWHSYRASKCALNMILKNLAIELKRRNAESIVLGLHPGTVDTGLSEPFQGNVPAGKLFSPERSAGHLVDVIESAGPEDSGRCFAWDGQVIPS